VPLVEILGGGAPLCRTGLTAMVPVWQRRNLRSGSHSWHCMPARIRLHRITCQADQRAPRAGDACSRAVPANAPAPPVRCARRAPSPPPRRALARVLPCRITGARRDRCSSNSHDAV